MNFARISQFSKYGYCATSANRPIRLERSELAHVDVDLSEPPTVAGGLCCEGETSRPHFLRFESTRGIRRRRRGLDPGLILSSTSSVRTRSLNYYLAKSNHRSGTEYFCGTTRRIETNDLRCASNENARLHYIHPFCHRDCR